MDGSILLERILKEALEACDGLQDRVCPVADITKNTGPLAVYDQLKEFSSSTLDGNASLLTAVFQVHVLNGTYMAMRMLAEDVKKHIEQLQGTQNHGVLIETVEMELATPDILEIKVDLLRRSYNVKFEYQIMEV